MPVHLGDIVHENSMDCAASLAVNAPNNDSFPRSCIGVEVQRLCRAMNLISNSGLQRGSRQKQRLSSDVVLEKNLRNNPNGLISQEQDCHLCNELPVLVLECSSASPMW